MVNQTALLATRHSLHVVAELVLAARQHAASSRITLAVTEAGFATRFEPDLAVVRGRRPAGDPSGDDFFTAPFGAARPIAELDGVDPVAEFFAEGLRRAG